MAQNQILSPSYQYQGNSSFLCVCVCVLFNMLMSDRVLFICIMLGMIVIMRFVEHANSGGWLARGPGAQGGGKREGERRAVGGGGWRWVLTSRHPIQQKTIKQQIPVRLGSGSDSAFVSISFGIFLGSFRLDWAILGFLEKKKR